MLNQLPVRNSASFVFLKLCDREHILADLDAALQIQPFNNDSLAGTAALRCDCSIYEDKHIEPHLASHYQHTTFLKSRLRLVPFDRMNNMNMSILQPRETKDMSKYSSINSIITWILAVSTIFAVMVKVAMKVVYQRTLNRDDAILILALVSLH